MTTRLALLSIASLLTCVSLPARAQDLRHALVDSVFAEWDRPDSPGCAVSVAENGAITYRRGYGMANLEYGIPITPSSIFHVASVSKQFTALAVALLAADGKLSLDDDVRAHVPEVPDFGHRITIRHLLHHTSGLRDQWSLLGMAGWRFEADVITQGDVLDITSRQRQLNFRPGDRYLYSNTGFTLAAVIVERVSGKTIREFAEERIFRPLGMYDTHFHDDHNMIVPNRAYAYARRDDGGWRISIPDFDVVGATSLFTTVEDLGAWDRNFYAARVGGIDVLRELMSRGQLNDGVSLDYALGISHGRYRGLATLGHGGADAGYRSQYLRFPDEDFGVAVLCNFPTSNPGGLASRVAEVYLEDRMEAEAPDARVESASAGGGGHEHVAGAYHHQPSDAVWLVFARNDSLFADMGRESTLTPVGNGRYRVGNGSLIVDIAPGEAGGDRELRMPGEVVPYTWRPAVEPGEIDLRAFVGTYSSDELGTEYRFVLMDGGLVRQHRKLPEVRLRPTYRDGFMGNGSYDFTRDDDGRVDGFTISTGRVWKVRFDRREPI